jgi:hypothetical protein
VGQPLQQFLLGEGDAVEVDRCCGRRPPAVGGVAAYRIVSQDVDPDAGHGPGVQLCADAGLGDQGTRLERLRTTHDDRFLEAQMGPYGELSQLVQTFQELGLVLSELPHQRGPLVLEEISALGDEDGSTPSVEELGTGGGKRLPGTLR